MLKTYKKIAAVVAVVLLAGGLDAVTTGPAEVSATAATRDKINKTQREKDNLEDELNKTQDNLDQLEGKRDTLEKELNYLNGQLSAVVDNLDNLERQIREKEQEIADTQAALEEAKATEEWQYESMVVLVRCMYEQPEENYLTALLTAGSFAEVLNMADRIEKMVAYDQRMLEAYKENRILIEEQEARLQEERIELDNLQAQAREERDKVSGLIDQTSQSIAKYGNQISDAEQKALAYEAQIKEKEKDLEYLNKVLAEELAKSQAAANGVWRDISEVTFAEGDKKLLANLIYCEAGAEPYDGKVAVGSVVINRVLSSQYPDTVVGVIYQNRQFSPVASGRLDLALAADIANNDCYRAAEEAMSGISNVGNCVYFRTPIEGLNGISIGGHIFY